MADPISSFSVVARDGKPVNEVIVAGNQGASEADTSQQDNENHDKQADTGQQQPAQNQDTELGASVTETETQGTTTPADTSVQDESKSQSEIPHQPSLEELISGKTNGVYKSVDDLVAAMNELRNKPVERSFKDDYIKKIVDYYESTGSLEPVLKALTTDYSKISDDAIFKMELREKYPNLSDKAFEKIYKREVIDKYNLDEENNEPDDVEIGRELMKHDAQQLREAKIKAQAEFKIPENNQSQGQPPDTNLSAAYEAWKNQVISDPVSNDLLSNKRIVVKHEGGDFNFELNDPAKVVEMGYNDKEFFKLFLKADGKIDFPKFYKVAAYAQNMETFEKSLITHGKSIGKTEVLDAIKNKKAPDSDGGSTPAADEGDSRIGLLKAFASKGVHIRN